MPEYNNAIFTGVGIVTQDPGPTYYSNYLVIRDINTNDIIDTYTTTKGLSKFDNLGFCVVKLVVEPAFPWRNGCCMVCPAGNPVPIANWSV